MSGEVVPYFDVLTGINVQQILKLALAAMRWRKKSRKDKNCIIEVLIYSNCG